MQPKNPEFRNNRENFHPCCYNWDPDEDRQNVGPDLDPNRVPDFFYKVNFEEKSAKFHD